MKVCYTPRAFRGDALKAIETANGILTDYAARGFTLTLRQLYYQFVARGLIANKQSEYKKLGELLNDARLAGLVDWNHMEDRTRNLERFPAWDSPAQIIRAVADQYAGQKWNDQPAYCEVWVEKEALVGIVESVCRTNDNAVNYFACRGYVSASEMWTAGNRFIQARRRDKETFIFHLGDHDPSGIQMTEDIERRLVLFCDHAGVEAPTVRRLALNMDQVQQYNPPPNPAKLTDSRAEGYIERFGTDSWELDALEPEVITQLIQDAIDEVRDFEAWDESIEAEAKQKATLEACSRRWTDVTSYLESA